LKTKSYLSEALLILVAIIWGLAFVAQRSGAEHIGPFTFNGIRFLLGGFVLLLFIRPLGNIFEQPIKKSNIPAIPKSVIFTSQILKQGSLVGTILFIAASLQQAGLVYTTAGNAGFITSLYIIFVPIIGLFFQQATQRATWIGAALAFIGLSLLSIKEGFSISLGDSLQLIGAVFWAFHILAIGYYAPKANPIKLSIIQFLVCGCLSLLVGCVIETTSIDNLQQGFSAILYTGILSTAIAYTLQVVAQRKVPAAHATIIFSLEAVFALIGGWMFLNETMTLQGLLGCTLMFLGVIISQSQSTHRK